MAVENMNIPSKILIVSKVKEYSDGAPQAYIVDPENRKQLDSARKWGVEYKYHGIFNQREEIEPIEYFVDNNNFTLTILDCAGSSSQGGKLSFWNCLIEREPDIRVVVGIDQTNLLLLLKQSTLINGRVSEKLSLAKFSSTAGVVHPGMQEWHKSKQNKLSGKAGEKKTTKWQLGRNYTSLTKDSLYIGDLYYWIEETKTAHDEIKHSIYSTSRVMHTHYKILEKPIVKHCILSLDWYIKKDLVDKIRSKEIKALSEIFDIAKSNINDSRNTAELYSLFRESLIFYTSDNLITSFPSRYTGDISLNTDNQVRDLQSLLDTCRNRALDLFRRTTHVSENALINTIGYSAVPDKRPVLTEQEKELILNASEYTTHIDFGDGVENTGKRK